jgi:hypothetical protein
MYVFQKKIGADKVYMFTISSHEDKTSTEAELKAIVDTFTWAI